MWIYIWKLTLWKGIHAIRMGQKNTCFPNQSVDGTFLLQVGSIKSDSEQRKVLDRACVSGQTMVCETIPFGLSCNKTSMAAAAISSWARCKQHSSIGCSPVNTAFLARQFLRTTIKERERGREIKHLVFLPNPSSSPSSWGGTAGHWPLERELK